MIRDGDLLAAAPRRTTIDRVRTVATTIWRLPPLWPYSAHTATVTTRWGRADCTYLSDAQVVSPLDDHQFEPVPMRPVHVGRHNNGAHTAAHYAAVQEWLAALAAEPTTMAVEVAGHLTVESGRLWLADRDALLRPSRSEW